MGLSHLIVSAWNKNKQPLKQTKQPKKNHLFPTEPHPVQTILKTNNKPLKPLLFHSTCEITKTVSKSKKKAD